MANNEESAKGFEFRKFATPRIIGGIAIVLIVLWALSIIFDSPKGPSSQRVAEKPHGTAMETDASHTARQTESTQPTDPIAAETSGEGHPAGTSDAADHETVVAHGTAADQESAGRRDTPAAHDTSEAETHGTTDHETAAVAKTDDSHGATTTHQTAAQDAQAPTHGTADQAAAAHDTAGHPLPAAIVDTPVHKPTPKGVTFVEAVIEPLNHELEERWWGWRPNDLIDLTDNVNNFQIGVLEVTRRTTVALAERISRTGTNDAYDEDLEQAMNWFMVKSTSYWFPSAESKYREGLEALAAYLEKLRAGKATFYTRTDNLIPLLATFRNLLGSCDENLVKQVNEDGTKVSHFAVDDYFFYTQGVASSMATVLEAVHHDFLLTLESRNGTELLHHAIVSCRQAAEIDPWIILDRNLSSVFANHRANLAAPISHALFYIGQLIKTLST